MKPRASFGLSALTILAGCIFFAGVGVGQYTHSFLPGAQPDQPDQLDLAKGYHFIDPLLICSDHELTGQSAAFSQSMQDKISAVIATEKKNGNISNASVYYRDLRNQARLSVNDTLHSEPASLLKVPLALSIRRKVEQDPAFLQQKVTMNIPDQNGGEHFPAPNKAEAGKVYTVEELLKLSLVDSDNNATDLLISQLSDSELRNSYSDLGIDVPVDNPNNYTMMVGAYSSFYRILYNASYLTRADSEQFLSDLTHSTFTKGIVAGVPDGTVVAHKFGEFSSDKVAAQLHDCGIIYKPNHPYLLCVMTQGQDFEKLANTIATISKVAWDAQ